MSSEQEGNSCCTSVEHQGHLCELESQQEWDIIRQVTDHPTVTCENCGNVANSSRNVCMPADL
jgi:uncharacterized Zn finger protein